MSDIKKVAQQVLAEIPDSNTQKKKAAYKLGRINKKMRANIGSVGGDMNDLTDLLYPMIDDLDPKVMKSLEEAFHFFEKFRHAMKGGIEGARRALQPNKNK